MKRLVKRLGAVVGLAVLGACNIFGGLTGYTFDLGDGGAAATPGTAGGLADGGDDPSTGSTTIVTVCTDDHQCATGACVDGYCCDERCDDACVACNLPSHEGTCSPVAAITPCARATGGRCDGAGMCTTGTPEWLAVYGGGGTQRPHDIAVASDGSAVVVGYHDGAFTIGNETLGHAGMGDVFVAKFNPDTSVAWTTTAGDAAEWQNAEAVAIGDAGSIVIGGNFKSGLDFAPAGGGISAWPGGAWDGFVARLGPDGQEHWSVAITGPGHQEVLAVATGSGTFAAAGLTDGDISAPLGTTGVSGTHGYVLAGAQSDHAMTWLTVTAGGPSIHRDAAIDAEGHVWAVGEHSGAGLVAGEFTLPEAGDTTVGYALRHNATDGTVLSAMALGDAVTDQRAQAIAAIDGGVVVAGRYVGALPLGPQSPPTASFPSLFVVALAPDGTPLWTVAGLGQNSGADLDIHDIAVDASGSIIIAGNLTGTLSLDGSSLTAVDDDPLLVKIAEGGQGVLWATVGGELGTSGTRGVAVGSDGHFFVTGHASGAVFGTDEPVGASDAWVALFEP